MNAYSNGDLLAQQNLTTKQSKSKQILLCEICFNTDEFSLCGDCFNKFNSKILRFKANTKKDNFELHCVIKEYIEKRKNEIEKFNKFSARKSNIDNLKKLINSAKSRVRKNNQNLENLKTQKQSIEQKIKNFEENISLLNNSIISTKKSFNNYSEILQKKNSEKNICVKNFFKKLLKLIFCGNKIFLFSEIFEKDEYVLPSLDKAAGSRKKFFDDFSNILSTEIKNFENFSIEDHKKPHYFEKHLKTKDSVINYNMNPFPYTSDKTLIKQHEKDFFNKLFVNEINNYVHKLILFAKISAKFLNIKLPCEIESESNLEISDNFDFSCERKKLLITDNYAEFNESASFAALLALDKSINFIKDYLGIKIKKSGLLPNYFNASIFNDKNNFEILASDKNNDYSNNNCENNNSNFNNLNNFYHNNSDSRRRNNSVSVNLMAKSNAENSSGFSFNVVNKPYVSTACNNAEFNADFLNITPFFVFCGESFEVQKFSINCEIIKKQTLNSNSNKNTNSNNTYLNNNNNNSNKAINEKLHKNNLIKHSSEKTYEILNEKGLNDKESKKHKNLNLEENNEDFVFEDIGINEEIISADDNQNDKNKKKSLSAKKKNEEDHGGFVIIDDYFEIKN